MVEQLEALQRLRAAMEAAELEDNLRLVAVLRRPIDPEELQVPTRDALVGWAIWPSTMHIANNTFGDELDSDAPLLDAEWVDEGATIRVWRDGRTLNAVSTDERDPPEEEWREGEHPSLRETVELMCQTPENSRAIYHVYWVLDPERNTLVRAFDRLVGYDPAP